MYLCIVYLEQRLRQLVYIIKTKHYLFICITKRWTNWGGVYPNRSKGLSGKSVSTETVSLVEGDCMFFSLPFVQSALRMRSVSSVVIVSCHLSVHFCNLCEQLLTVAATCKTLVAQIKVRVYWQVNRPAWPERNVNRMCMPTESVHCYVCVNKFCILV